MLSNDDGEACDLKIMAAVSLSCWREVRDFFFCSTVLYLTSIICLCCIIFWENVYRISSREAYATNWYNRASGDKIMLKYPVRNYFLMRSFNKLFKRIYKNCWTAIIQVIWGWMKTTELVKISVSLSIRDHLVASPIHIMELVNGFQRINN